MAEANEASSDGRRRPKPLCAVPATTTHLRRRRNNRHATAAVVEGELFNVYNDDNDDDGEDANSYLSMARGRHLFSSSNRSADDEAVIGASAAVADQHPDPDQDPDQHTDQFNLARSVVARCQNPPRWHLDVDWDQLGQCRLQELNEIRQRAAQMENTMRWWLSSAEQWREKWLAVKGERNALRDENLRLRNALAIAKAECRSLKGPPKTGKTEQGGRMS